MNVRFTKMHAIGNDYIFINGWDYPDLIERAKEIAVKWSDRHFGIGGDGVIFVLPSESADFTMRIFNADGSEAEMCGNGIRQAVKFALDHGIVSGKTVRVDTLAGQRIIDVMETGENLRARVDMGAPILDPVKIPVNVALTERGFATIDLDVDGRHFSFTLVSMGNPHAVTFVEDVDSINLPLYGRIIENLTYIFPRRTNVEFAHVTGPTGIRMRVWERGSGETLACGTGACATLVAAALNGLTERKATLSLTGGPLDIEWIEGGTVYMTGNAVTTFTGEAEA